MIEICVANLYEYNSGKAIGRDIVLPMKEEKLREIMKDILGNNDEYIITDWTANCGINLNQYKDVYEINKLAILIRDIETNIVSAISDYYNNDISKIIKCIENQSYDILNDVDDEEDLGREIVSNGFFHIEIPENLKHYLNYQTIGEEYISGKGWLLYDNFAIRIHLTNAC